MLSCFYIDNANYQENIIPRNNKKDGHDVYIIASRDTFISNNVIGLQDAGNYINEDEIPVTRLNYKNIINDKISMKIRAYEGLWEQLEKIKPDVILFHGACAWELNTVGNYISKYPNTKLYVDSHEDFFNSANGFVSKHVLHNLFYKRILQKNLKYIEKVLYITKETYNFLHDFYKVPKDKLEFFPLGGELPDTSFYQATREKRRKEIGAKEGDIICIHSGKLDKLKRTEEMLSAFTKIKRTDLKFIIIGKVEADFENTFQKFLENDDRINYLGWKSAKELREYLMAGDLYLQLGSQSATMQQAICNGNVVALYPFESHTYLLGESAFYMKNEEDMISILNNVSWHTLDQMKQKSTKIVTEILDYEKISRRIYNI